VVDLFDVFAPGDMGGLVTATLAEAAIARTPEENDSFASEFANAIVGAEGIPLGMLMCPMEVIATQYVPFLLIFSWNCHNRPGVSRVITGLLPRIGPETLSPLPLCIVIVVALFQCPELREPLLELINRKIALLADVFQVSRFLAPKDREIAEFQNALASGLIRRIRERNDSEAAQAVVNICTNFLCWWPIIEETPTMDDLAAIIGFLTRQTDIRYVYRLRIEDGQWLDMELGLALMELLPIKSLSMQTQTQLLVVLSFLCHKSLGLGSRVSQYLDRVGVMDAMPTLVAPLQLQVAQHVDDFLDAAVFFEAFRDRTVATIDRVEVSDSTMSLFVASLRDPSHFVEKLRDAFSTSLPKPVGPSLDDILESAERRRLAYERSLASKFADPAETREKRQNYFDLSLRPLLFTRVRPNAPFHSDISGVVVWTVAAERHKFSRVIAGRFVVTENGYYFEAATKTLYISAQTIRLVFWSWHRHKPDSFTVFATTGPSYLFRIPNSTHAHFLTPLRAIQLPACIFFQSTPPQSALESLELTHKWRTHMITTFEYLSWLNMLSGRSWHSAECYPVFPLLFYTDGSGRRCDRPLNRSVGSVNSPALAARPLLASAFDSFDRYLFAETYSTPSGVRALLETASLDAFFKAIGAGESISELTPEFFCLPEALSGRPLPPWAPSTTALVAQHSERLESESGIHKWIDLIWGVDQQPSYSTDRSNAFDPRLSAGVWDFDVRDPAEIDRLLATCGQLPHVLFAGPHPARARPSARPSGAPRTLPTTESAVTDFFVCGTTPDALKVVTAHADDRIFVHQLPAVSVQFHTAPQVRRVGALRFVDGGDSPSFAFAPAADVGPLFYDLDARAINSPRDPGHILPVTTLAVGHGVIASASSDGVICAWTRGMARVGRLFQHRSAVEAMTVSEEVGILASCDSGGTLIISLLPKLIPLARIDLGRPARFVAVLQRTGSVVVTGEDDCRNWTMNGTQIGTTKVTGPVRAICPLPSGHFALVDGENELAIYNGFSMEKARTVFHCAAGISAVKYHRRLGLFFCIRSDNSVVIVPFGNV
jgi:hypothetical protein